MKDTLKTINVLLMLKSLEDKVDNEDIGDEDISDCIWHIIQEIKAGNDLDEY